MTESRTETTLARPDGAQPVKVLILADYFPPAQRAGGPPTSIKRIVDQSNAELLVLCRDRDKGVDSPFPIESLHYQLGGRRQVMYLDISSGRKLLSFLRILTHAKADVVYVNSFHSRVFGVLPLLLHRLGLMGSSVLVVSPRGEFAGSALDLGSRLKGPYWLLWKGLRQPARVVWLASSEKERDEIQLRCGAGARVETLPVTSRLEPLHRPTAGSASHGNDARTLCFIGRVAPVKGLLEGLTALLELSGTSLRLDIFGPLHDPAYWTQCQEVISRMPDGIVVAYCGQLAPAEVSEVLQRADGFFMPTYGENFGHAIAESLASSCPVIVGRTTPWTEYLDSGGGWTVEPHNMESIVNALRDFCANSDEALLDRREQALRAAVAWNDDRSRDISFDALCETLVESASHG